MATDLILHNDPGGLAKCATLTPTSLTFSRQLDLDEWLNYMELLFFVRRGTNWWIGDTLNQGEDWHGESYAQAEAIAERYGILPKRLSRLQWVSRQVNPVLRNTGLSWSHHYMVASDRLTDEDRVRLLTEAAERNLDPNEFRHLVQAYLGVLAEKRAGPLPDGEFHVLLADPPWPYDFAPSESASIESHYPTSDLTSIYRLLPDPLGRCQLADDAVLFLWAPPPKLADALPVLEAWGFGYVTCAVWDKQVSGMGYWFLQQHEVILVATRGDFSPPPHDQRCPSILGGRRTEHSVKPDALHELIEGWWPDLTRTERLELYGRRDRPGWTVWGDEVAGAEAAA